MYVGLFALLIAVIASGYHAPESNAQLNELTAAATSTPTQPTSTAQTASIDEVVATSVAASAAEQTSMPIARNLANTSVSLSAQSELSQTSDSVITKPQIVQSNVQSRDIQMYTVQPGDTIPSLAVKFNVSPETIRWVNNIEGDLLPAGKQLKILPVNGIVHTMQPGETVASVAQKYGADAARIVSYNDLEISTVTNGQTLIIPDGVLPANERPGYQAASATAYTAGTLGGYTPGVDVSKAGASAGNRYAPGYCTWYAYERRAASGRPVGSFWGNASTWAANASAAGFLVDNRPAAGAVMQTSYGGGGYGHVAYVESVDSSGDVHLREMNYAGFGVVSSRVIPAGQAGSYNYIH